jgi:hypothetical protein
MVYVPQPAMATRDSNEALRVEAARHKNNIPEAII